LRWIDASSCLTNNRGSRRRPARQSADPHYRRRSELDCCPSAARPDRIVVDKSASQRPTSAMRSGKTSRSRTRRALHSCGAQRTAEPGGCRSPRFPDSIPLSDVVARSLLCNLTRGEARDCGDLELAPALSDGTRSRPCRPAGGCTLERPPGQDVRSRRRRRRRRSSDCSSAPLERRSGHEARDDVEHWRLAALR
jgi:hypothetical protein